MLKRIFFVTFALFTASCAPPREIHDYALKDSNGRTYADGDYLRYHFVGISPNDGSAYEGDWIIKWKSTSLVLPSQAPADFPRALMAVSSAVMPVNSGAPSYATLYFVEQKAGNLKLFGVQQETSTTPFLVQNENGGFGVTLYSSPFVLNNNQTSLFMLFPCNAAVCLNNINDYTNLAKFSVDAIETVKTPFGNFEAYRMTVKQILRATYSENQQVKSIAFPPLMNGTVWIYPPLGMVKAKIAYVDSVTSISYNYASELVETNIALSP